FFNDMPPAEIYTLSLHDALPIWCRWRGELVDGLGASSRARYRAGVRALFVGPSGTGKTLAAGWLATTLGLPLYRVDLASVTSKRSEEHTSELQSRGHLVCRLLLE